MKNVLPLYALVENFGLISKSLRPKLGRKSYFTPDGKVALIFLKMYTGLICPKLMAQLNGNIHYQPDVLTIEGVDNYQTGKGDYKVSFSF